jgi:hypothetical protein
VTDSAPESLRIPSRFNEARLATERYRGSSDNIFSSCFVCGKAREGSFEVRQPPGSRLCRRSASRVA